MTRPRRTRSAIRLLMLLAALSLVAPACGSDDDTASSDTTEAGSTETTAGADEGEAPSGEPIKIGAPLNLTGPASVLGIQVHEGLEATQKAVNESGGVLGRPVEFLVRDCESSPQRCAEVAQLLIERDQVVAMIGPDGTPTSLSVIPVLAARQIPGVVIAGGWPMGLTQEEQEWAFLAFPRLVRQFEALEEQLWKPQGWTKVAVIGPTGPFLDAPKGYFEQYEGDMELVALEGFAPGATDITAQVQAVAEADPDFVLLWANGADVVTMFNAFHTLAPEINIAPQAVQRFEDHGVSEEALDGVYAVAFGPTLAADGLLDASDPRYEPSIAFLEAMEAAGFDPLGGNHAGYSSWDSAHSLFQAMEDVGSTDADDVRESLETQVFQGSTGELFRSPEDHEGLDASDSYGYAVLQRQDGKWVVAGEG